jgi:hypothetical protein
MAVSNQEHTKSEDWVEVRGVTSDESGFEFPKYETKVLSNIEKQHIEDDIVMLKQTDPRSGHEKIYHLPTEVVEGMAKQVQTQQ